MIRINLLPVPKARKQEALIIQAAAGVFILLAIAGACYLVGMTKNAELDQIQQQITVKQREIEELKAKVGEVDKFKKQAQQLEQQLAVIRSLEAGRTGPVRMLDELTQLVPRKLWITTFRESNKKVTIEGYAETGPIIADFLENLKLAKHFSAPQLSVVQGQETEGEKMQKFTVTANVRYDL